MCEEKVEERAISGILQQQEQLVTQKQENAF
jgi:hypothetical protein